ncbi:MAG: cob(I)yrinic acid a,c-diamide adenosyltransferase [Opitutales bacterium]
MLSPEAADTVSEIGVVKHAFQAGIKAHKGIELWVPVRMGLTVKYPKAKTK